MSTESSDGFTHGLEAAIQRRTLFKGAGSPAFGSLGLGERGPVRAQTVSPVDTAPAAPAAQGRTSYSSAPTTPAAATWAATPAARLVDKGRVRTAMLALSGASALVLLARQIL